MAAFRDAVWANKGFGEKPNQWASCSDCGHVVLRTTDYLLQLGGVDHIESRSRAPEKKYDPDNAQILCEKCHRKKHGIKEKQRD